MLLAHFLGRTRNEKTQTEQQESHEFRCFIWMFRYNWIASWEKEEGSCIVALTLRCCIIVVVGGGGAGLAAGGRRGEGVACGGSGDGDGGGWEGMIGVPTLPCDWLASDIEPSHSPARAWCLAGSWERERAFD